MAERAQAVTDQELEETLAYAAYLMLRYGDWIAPLFDRLETEMEARRHAQSPMARAKAALERYTVPAGGVKAIR